MDNRKSLNETEKRNKLDVIVNFAKEESKTKKSFDINKLKKEDREVLTRKSPCLSKVQIDDLNPDCAASEAKIDNQNRNDEILKKSVDVMNKSVNARKIIETVIERIESKKFIF